MRVHPPVPLPRELPGSNRAWILVPLLALAAAMAGLVIATDDDTVPEPTSYAAPGPLSLPVPAVRPSTDPAGEDSVARMLELQHVQAF